MAGIADLFGLGGGSSFGDLSSVYGDLLTPEQRQGLAMRGLMAAAGALGQAAMPSRMPVPIGAALGSAAGAMASGQDEAAMNALRAALVGQQAQKLKSEQAIRDKLMGVLPSLLGGDAGATPAPAQPAVASMSPASLGTAPADAAGDPGSLVKKYESGGNYNVGFGGADLSNAPRNEFGFPIWEGKTFIDKDGQLKRSHAAGAYQFQPATWAQYAGPLGIKDFSKESQDKVFAAAYADQGMRPWAPFNSKLAAAARGGEVAAPGALPGVPDFSGMLAGNQGPAYAPALPPQDQVVASPSNLDVGRLIMGGTVPNTPTGRSAAAPMSQLSAAYANAVGQGFRGTIQDFVRQPEGGASGGASPTMPMPAIQPISSAPAPAAQAPMSLAPPPAGGPVAASPPLVGGINPRALAAAGVLAQLGGIGDAFKPLENYYYQSPGYKAAVETATRGAGLPFVQPEAFAKEQGTRSAGIPYDILLRNLDADLAARSERYKTELGVAAGSNQPVVTSPGQTVNVNPNRVPLPPLPNQLSGVLPQAQPVAPPPQMAQAAPSAPVGAPAPAGGPQLVPGGGMQFSGADVGDVERAKIVPQEYVNDLVKNRLPSANVAAQNLAFTATAKNLLDRDVIVGWGANLRLDAAKLGKYLGVETVAPDTIANTETLVAQQARQAAAILATRAFGAGSGISDEDRRWAAKMAAADSNLDKESMRRIIDLSERASRWELDKYNTDVNRFDPAKQFPYLRVVEQAAPPMPASSIPAPALPDGVPAGSRQVGMTKDGRPVFDVPQPDGSVKRQVLQ